MTTPLNPKDINIVTGIAAIGKREREESRELMLDMAAILKHTHARALSGQDKNSVNREK